MPITKIYEGANVEGIIRLPDELKNKWLEVYALERNPRPESIRETGIPVSDERREQIKSYCKKKSCTYDDAIEMLLLQAELLDRLFTVRQHRKRSE